MPPMIWVMLDESLATGTHEFADSVNNGPWGPRSPPSYPVDRIQIPHGREGQRTLPRRPFIRGMGDTPAAGQLPEDLRRHLVHFARPQRLPRFQSDRSLRFAREPLSQTRRQRLSHHPRPRKNPRHHGTTRPAGASTGRVRWPAGILRMGLFTTRSRRSSGTDVNRDTGDVDPAVVAYWHDYYDLANIVSTDWNNRGKDLKGKLHLIVGTADTFYLDGAAHKFEAVLKSLNADPHFTYIDNRTHFDLYKEGDDRMALFDKITLRCTPSPVQERRCRGSAFPTDPL